MNPNDKKAPPAADEDDDKVQEASEESFPASDPPAWSPMHPGAPKTKPTPEKKAG